MLDIFFKENSGTERKTFLKDIVAGVAVGGMIAAGGVYVLTSRILSMDLLEIPHRENES